MIIIIIRLRIIIITLFILILLFSSYINKVLAEDLHFETLPYIANKNLHIISGNVILEFDLDFIAKGFSEAPISVFLTISGGSSNNLLCIDISNGSSEQHNTLFGSVKGQIVHSISQNGEIIFKRLHISLTAPIDKTICPNNKSPIIRSVLLQNVELYLVENDNSKYITFTIGDLNLPTGYLDKTPNG